MGPATKLIFLGIEIDTLDMVIRIPEEKIVALKNTLVEVLDKTKITLRDLQSLVGTLNFCSKANI